MIKWNMSYTEAREAFEYGDTLNKEDTLHLYFVQQLEFVFNTKRNTIRIKGVVLKENKRTIE